MHLSTTPFLLCLLTSTTTAQIFSGTNVSGAGPSITPSQQVGASVTAISIPLTVESTFGVSGGEGSSSASASLTAELSLTVTSSISGSAVTTVVPINPGGLFSTASASTVSGSGNVSTNPGGLISTHLPIPTSSGASATGTATGGSATSASASASSSSTASSGAVGKADGAKIGSLAGLVVFVGMGILML